LFLVRWRAHAVDRQGDAAARPQALAWNVAMPAVFRDTGFRFFFYSNEGKPREPLHVHIRAGGHEAKP
jgi:hypothetical protein